MEFIIQHHRNGDRTIHIPRGESIPTIFRPDLWVGQGSTRSSRGIKLSIGSVMGDEVNLVMANGNHEWRDYPEDPGVEILTASGSEAGWDFAEKVLKLWLEEVFGGLTIIFRREGTLELDLIQMSDQSRWSVNLPIGVGRLDFTKLGQMLGEHNYQEPEPIELVGPPPALTGAGTPILTIERLEPGDRTLLMEWLVGFLTEAFDQPVHFSQFTARVI